jgi:uncharacterized protein YodC (DUF2158 family)
VTKYKVGDVVVLKSGGPLMTVHSIGLFTATAPDEGLLCVWFDDKRRVEDVFHPDAVEPYTNES